MKKFLLFISVFVFFINADGQSLDNRYFSYVSNKGVVYFFYPQKLSKVEGIENFCYDLTYVANSDLATLNFTIETKNIVEIAELGICYANDTIKIEDYSMLFRDVVKNGYETRITNTIKKTNLLNIYGSSETMCFILTLKDGRICKASYNRKRWKKDSSVFTKILNSIY